MIQFPPKRILVAFDFTRPSLAAYDLARALAKKLGATLDVVYVEERVSYPLWDIATPRLTAPTQKEIARHVRSKVGPAAKIHVAEGEASTAILHHIAKLKPHMVAMGTHGRTGLNRFWMGSVAEAVIRRSPVPVLAVRNAVEPFTSVLAPINFSEHSEMGLKFAAGVAASFRLPLTALHVTEPSELCHEPQARLEALFRALPPEVLKACRPKAMAVDGVAVEAIVRTAKKNSLVVMVAHAKSLVEELMLGSTLERVLRLSHSAVLAVPALSKRFHAERWTSTEARVPMLRTP